MGGNMVFIFYDVEITPGKEMEQLGAVASTGEHFSTFIKATTRRTTSPILRRISPEAMTDMKPWVNSILARNEDKGMTEEDVVILAHNGSRHNHVLLLKAMMNWGVNVPSWRFSDTLPIFKIVIQPDASAELSDLVTNGLPRNMWPEAVRYANYVRNRNPTADSKTDPRTPYERFTNKRPRCSEFRQWGCPVWWRPGRTKKFRSFVDENGSQGHFVGFESPHILRIWTTSGRVTTASQVRYKEPLPTGEPQAKRRRINLANDDCESEPDEDDQPTRIVVWEERDFAAAKEFTRRTLKPRKKSKGIRVVPDPPPPPTRRSQRLVNSNGSHKPKRFLHDDEVKAITAVYQRYQADGVEPSLIHAFLVAKLPEDPYEPKSWKSAQQHLHKDLWIDAAGEELKSLNDNEIWELVDLSRSGILWET